MKKLLLTAGLLIVACGMLSAQIKRIVINTQGGYDVIVEVGQRQYVAVTADGYLVDVQIDGRKEYYDRFSTFDDDLIGKLRRVGSVNFEYYDRYSTFDRALYGKIRRVGRVNFDYHTNSFSTQRDRDGLLSAVGATRIDYYDSFGSFNRGKSGKVERIGAIRFDFYGENDFFSSFDSGQRWKVGMLKSINANRYDYSRTGAVRPGSSHGSGAGYGQAGGIRMSGPTTVRAGGIVVNVIESGRRPRNIFDLSIN